MIQNVCLLLDLGARSRQSQKWEAIRVRVINYQITHFRVIGRLKRLPVPAEVCFVPQKLYTMKYSPQNSISIFPVLSVLEVLNELFL